MKITLTTLLLFLTFSTHASSATTKAKVEFIPFSAESSIAKKKRADMLSIFAAMSQDDRVKLKQINSKYKQFIDIEKAKNTPLDSRHVYNTIRLAQFNEIIEKLSPEVVSAIMRTKMDKAK